MADTNAGEEKPAEVKKPDPWAGFEKPMPEYKIGFLGTFDKFFQISARGSTYPRELVGGLTTFVSMVYILTVNPNILSTANPVFWDSVFIATCLASFISTCVMALLPRVPFALSCGLGLNAQVMLYTLGLIGPKYTFGGAMTIVFLSGIIFLVITMVGFREYIFDAIPKCIKSAIPVGIGLFIAFIGMQNASIVIGAPESTLVTFVSIHDMYLDKDMRTLAFNALVCFIGLFAICILDHYRIKGCVFLGIVIAALIGIAFGVTPVKNITIGWNVGERFKNFFSFDESKGATFGMCFPGFKDAFTPATKVPSTIVLIISYGMVDLFDTLGTVYGLGLQSNLLDKETGKCHNFSRVLFADCIGAVFGSIFGTSSVTTYLESSTGIAVGARTGLAALMTAVLFLLSMFLSPIFFMIPGCATAPALIYVGVQMMSTVIYIDFAQIIDAIPVFMTIVMMPLTYSITNGMCIGVITYTVVHIIRFLVDCCSYLITGKIYNPAKVEAVEQATDIEVVPATTTSTGTDNAEPAKTGEGEKTEASPTEGEKTEASPIEDISTTDAGDSGDAVAAVSDSSTADAAAAAAANEATTTTTPAAAAVSLPSASADDDEKKKTEEAEVTKPVWPINIGLGIITLLFALTVFLPIKFTKD